MTTILFTDDNKSVREVCKHELQQQDGYQVILARDGAEAIELVEQERPDVVILDLCKGKVGGLDAVEPIRAIAPDVPIILFTADQEDCARDDRSRFATACVEKCTDLRELRQAIVKALASRDGNQSSRSGTEEAESAVRPVRPPIPGKDLPEAAVASSVASVTVNAAFLQEIKEDNLELRRLLAQIREAFGGAGSLRGRWRRFVELLGELRDELAMYFGLEETYGYFENPVPAAPRLSRHAQALRTQHRRLYSEICAILEQAEQRLYREARASPPRKIVQRLTAFCDQLWEHEGLEDDLIFRAFTERVSGRRSGAVVRPTMGHYHYRLPARMASPGLPGKDKE